MKPRWTSVPAIILAGLVLTGVLSAQTATAAAKKPTRRSAAATSEDVAAIRRLLEQQQQQIQRMQQQLDARDAALQQLQQQLQQTQSHASTAQTAAQEAQSTSTTQKDTLGKLESDVADLKTTLTNAAASTQDDQKRVGAVEGIVNRFRFSGDVRVRYENFIFGYAGCVAPNCDPRHRPRIRARFGVEGKLSDDFTGGIFLATGQNEAGAADLTDPVSTNNTLTSFFQRKTVGLDRAWIAYQPLNHKWLSLTGGKFAFTWNRTPLTFDNDINPEGFSEKLAWDFSHRVFKNLTWTNMQLFFREINSGTSRVDSSATGGQLSAKLQLGGRVTVTPSASLLRWNNVNSIAAARTGGTLSGNALTNSTNPAKTAYLSGFFYSDYIVDTTVKTWSASFPWRVLLEYEQNLNAVPSVVTGTKQDKAYWIETSLGQAKNKNDLQFGYGFARIEQDAVIAAFVESDLRAPTNLVQHRLFFGWLPRANTTINWTWWIGRTLNPNLPNAALPSGLPPGEEDPWLKRMQVDLSYKF